MKRRLVKCVAGACVAGMIAGVPGVAEADQVAGESEVVEWSAGSENVICLYGPPSTFDPVEEPIQVLYGPPEWFNREENPMQVRTTSATVKERRLAVRKKVFKRVIQVDNPVGELIYSKVAKGSSKRLAVNASTGAVTVKKGTKKGTYRVKVSVTAAGDSQYLPATKTVVVKVRVK